MAPLTRKMIEQGAAFVRALEQDDVTILAAFWYLEAEFGRWRLFIATPDIGRIGWQELYGKAHVILDRFAPEPAFKTYDVGILGPNRRIFQTVSEVVTTGPELGGERFTNQIANGELVDDIYVYKQTIEPPPKPGRRRRKAA
ncbi:hypothetical protein CCS01_24185 [Rhodopila globiformis]|uniref:Uncharacterized protein n=2 Tax=Rhodopila globiformis TaxID=1071 RepID=A0A2S6N1G3_RHOGL|nr:hypothetical protein CCS01_24185 [Rhodopila globiformis]